MNRLQRVFGARAAKSGTPLRKPEPLPQKPEPLPQKPESPSDVWTRCSKPILGGKEQEQLKYLKERHGDDFTPYIEWIWANWPIISKKYGFTGLPSPGLLLTVPSLYTLYKECQS